MYLFKGIVHIIKHESVNMNHFPPAVTGRSEEKSLRGQIKMKNEKSEEDNRRIDQLTLTQ